MKPHLNEWKVVNRKTFGINYTGSLTQIEIWEWYKRERLLSPEIEKPRSQGYIVTILRAATYVAIALLLAFALFIQLDW